MLTSSKYRPGVIFPKRKKTVVVANLHPAPRRQPHNGPGNRLATVANRAFHKSSFLAKSQGNE